MRDDPSSLLATDHPDPAFVVKEQVRLIYMQAPISNSIVFVIVILYYFILESRVNSGMVGLWAVLMLLAASFRLQLWLRRRNDPSARSDQRWMRLYLFGSAMVGGCWSLIYPLFYFVDNVFVSTALLMLAFGVMSSAVAVLAVSVPAFVLYTYPQGLTLLSTFLLFEDTGYYWLSTAVGIYMVMITLFTRNANRSIMRSIALQFHNTTLIGSLNREIAQRERLIAQRTHELEIKNLDLSNEVRERQRAEQALKRVNTDLATTLKTIPDLLFELDEDGRYLEIWARDSEMLAARRETLLGNTVSEVLPPVAADQVMAAIAEASRNGYSQGQVLRLPLPQGEHWFELSTAMKPGPDAARHFIMLSRDITDKQLIAEELEAHRQNLENMVEQRTRELVEARDHAERLSRVKSEFLANMSHEIRTPMNGVLGMTELLSSEDLSETQRFYVDTIQQSGSVLLRIIDDVLDFSRIESGRLEVESVIFDLVEILLDIERLFQATARNKGLKLAIELHSDLHRIRRGDPKRVTQILFNLVGNALKFTDHGTVRIVAMQLATTPATVLIEVSDTGIGIPAESQKYLFQAFQQEDSSISRKFGGSGLGLAISRRLAQLMNGDIELDSSQGKGSTFSVRLQLPRVTPKDAGLRDRSAYRHPPRVYCSSRVLVVEDNPVNQVVAQEMLESLGCSVCMTENGEQALAAFRGGNFDIVLMDLHMPGMDGSETTRNIRVIERDGGSARRTPIVALTADVLPEQRSACKRSGMDDFLAKPFSLDQLKAVLDRSLGAV